MKNHANGKLHCEIHERQRHLLYEELNVHGVHEKFTSMQNRENERKI